ncbi:MAG: sterol desaturase family protein [Bacteroidia bacterium]|nr:sterol desaturase family protein [Bacteroidia bacterium]
MELIQGQLGSYKLLFLLVIFSAMLAEVIWNHATHHKGYHPKETLANFLIFIGHQFFGKVIYAGMKLAVLDFVYRISPFQIENNVWTFLFCFILVDFAYFWFHWASHKVKFLWAFHHTHHSSTLYNLSGAYRLNWFGGLVNLIFFVPIILLGFSPMFVVASISLNLFYQFFLHTEAIGKLGFLEKILNTPSAHRVHHGSDEEYLDKNFGGVFIIWDRLFRTYREETFKPKYGVTTGFVGYNPLKIIFKGFIELTKGVKVKP